MIKQFICVFILFLGLNYEMQGQGDVDDLILTEVSDNGFEVKVEAGFYTGILINLNFLVYNSGFGASVMPGYRVNDYFGIYGGLGIERLEDGVLLPFFLDLESYLSKKKKGYIDVRLGYSSGFNNRSVNIEYNYKGGFLFSIGAGRDLYENSKIRLGFLVSYNFRQSKTNFKPFENSQTLTSKFDYNLASIKMTFAIK